MKMACENAINAGAKGIKILCGGRLAGAEIARTEKQKLGSIPLQTLDANVDYGIATARTTYGAIGIKVWIYKGKFGEEPVARHSVRVRAGEAVAWWRRRWWWRWQRTRRRVFRGRSETSRSRMAPVMAASRLRNRPARRPPRHKNEIG